VCSIKEECPDRMKTMQEQMHRIRQTTDPAERQQPLQEHMQAMQGRMKDMRAIDGGMMMGMMGQGGGKGRHGEGMMDPKARGKMMQYRVDMMQMMMEQMQAPAPSK
jgi:hypothetical protein